ncbi:MAG: serine/threonine protein kinase, partial [Planctomycetota bacterium]
MGKDPLDPDTTPTLGPENTESGGSVPSGTRSGESGSKKKLGPYEIIEEIGRGGMGVVYKAFHPQLKRTVALKVLIAGEDASEEAIARFHREAEAVAKLGHHPNIVPIYDIGQVVGAFRETPLHFFAMHFVDGKPLDKMIDDGELSPKQAAVITKKLAEALHHAHQHGILHRDVKPANVLMAFTKLEGERFDRLTAALSGVEGPPGEPKSEIPNLNGKKIEGSAHVGGWDLEVGGSAREGGEPMLTDFGLAKDVESESKMTRSGMTLGTPAYMPPEQADGRLEEIDERSDVYSLGATLYEMLTLGPPFEGSAVVNVIKKVLMDDPVSPRKKNPEIDRDLETICLKCLEKEPERRYTGAGALARDLENWIEGAPIAARPASFRTRVVKKARRHKTVVVTAMISTFLLVLCACIAAFLLYQKEKQNIEQKAIANDEKDRADSEALAKAEEARLREKNLKIAKVLMEGAFRLGDIHKALKSS